MRRISIVPPGPAQRFLRAAVLAAAFAAAACSSADVVESASTPPAPPLVSAAELADELGLTREAFTSGRVALTAPDGDAILLFPETTVATVHGRQLATFEPVRLRDGDAWVSQGDATTIRTMWAHAAADDTWIPPWVPPGLPPAPGSAARQPAPPRATGSDQPTAQEIRAWSVTAPRRAWRYIVIHHSATDSGSAAQFDAWHRKKGWDGLGYHFVIGNGRGSPDGAVEVGYRWRQQKRGAHAGNDEMNELGVGICLVGDFTKARPTWSQMRALNRLCNFLSVYCGIPRENYRLHGEVRDTACPGPNFPRDFLATPRATSGALAGGVSSDTASY